MEFFGVVAVVVATFFVCKGVATVVLANLS